MLNEILDSLDNLVIEEDRYFGVYSGGKYLAFNMSAGEVACLDHDAGDMDCEDFWDMENRKHIHIIGKGDTPTQALLDLVQQLKAKE